MWSFYAKHAFAHASELRRRLDRIIAPIQLPGGTIGGLQVNIRILQVLRDLVKHVADQHELVVGRLDGVDEAVLEIIVHGIFFPRSYTGSSPCVGAAQDSRN